MLLPGLPVRLTLIALACVGFAGAIPNLTAASADVVPASRRGLGFALLQFLMTLGGAAGPLLVGIVSDAVGSLRLAMLACCPRCSSPSSCCKRTTRSTTRTPGAPSPAGTEDRPPQEASVPA